MDDQVRWKCIRPPFNSPQRGRLVLQRGSACTLSWNHPGTDQIFPRPTHATQANNTLARSAPRTPPLVDSLRLAKNKTLSSNYWQSLCARKRAQPAYMYRSVTQMTYGLEIQIKLVYVWCLLFSVDFSDQVKANCLGSCCSDLKASKCACVVWYTAGCSSLLRVAPYSKWN